MASVPHENPPVDSEGRLAADGEAREGLPNTVGSGEVRSREHAELRDRLCAAVRTIRRSYCTQSRRCENVGDDDMRVVEDAVEQGTVGRLPCSPPILFEEGRMTTLPAMNEGPAI